VIGENWLRIIEQVQGFPHRDEREHRESRADTGAREKRKREAVPALHREARVPGMTSPRPVCC
jgi:hypothetical protein